MYYNMRFSSVMSIMFFISNFSRQGGRDDLVVFEEFWQMNFKRINTVNLMQYGDTIHV
jgi:hypothetical protein